MKRKPMNVVGRAKFCRDVAILNDDSEETIEILRDFQSDSSIFFTAKIPISEWATGTLIMLGKLKYEENVTEDMDYILEIYKEFKKEYEKGNLEL
ncbi:hypothetical protein [Enterococcus cecorum]|uniref:Uncharacterized protein n=1 Tax=Enterococcus cecorum TaxID=44008 RepID=A0A7X9RLN9_9ENTE|nr:hypothetical protein [Enterococcus cecorum]NME50772.1 hypothetical protein [Enterococcus cecorum]